MEEKINPCYCPHSVESSNKEICLLCGGNIRKDINIENNIKKKEKTNGKKI